MNIYFTPNDMHTQDSRILLDYSTKMWLLQFQFKKNLAHWILSHSWGVYVTSILSILLRYKLEVNRHCVVWVRLIWVNSTIVKVYVENRYFFTIFRWNHLKTRYPTQFDDTHTHAHAHEHTHSFISSPDGLQEEAKTYNDAIYDTNRRNKPVDWHDHVFVFKLNKKKPLAEYRRQVKIYQPNQSIRFDNVSELFFQPFHIYAITAQPNIHIIHWSSKASSSFERNETKWSEKA